MLSRRTSRQVPLRFDDGFRGGIASLISLPLLIASLVLLLQSEAKFELAFMLMCASFVLFFIIYLYWTHRVFSRVNQVELARISVHQSRAGVSGASRVIGLRTSEEWAMFAAGTAMLVAVAASIIGARSGGIWLPLLVLVTVASAWATVVYAFALRYLRLHYGGETIEFVVEQPLVFSDFVSMSVMAKPPGSV